MRIRPLLVVSALVLTGVSTASPALAMPRPENGEIAFGRFDPALGDFSIWVANPDGTHQRPLTTVPSHISDWSPSGNRIAYDFVDDIGQHIATISPDGTFERQITFGSGIQGDPRWSPDGRRITFDASPLSPDDPSFSTSIWVMRADGSHARQVTSDGFDVEPVFSPDGKRIAFGRITGVTAAGDQLEAVYVVDVDGTHLRQVVPPLAGLEHPDWSPNGAWISFNIAPESVNAPDSGSIITVHPNGNGLRVLQGPSDDLRFFKPVWSPDGRKLLVGCHNPQTGLDQLCVLDANGRNAHVIILGSPYPVNFPAWGSHPPQQ
jgi:Tol biopolymer transport system component